MALTQADLKQFTGTEKWYKHPLTKLIYTDGIKYLAENAGGGAYWLLDLIGFEFLPLNKTEEFMAIKMYVENNSMAISIEDGNEYILTTKDIPYTDFPAGDWVVWLVGGTLLLPSEY